MGTMVKLNVWLEYNQKIRIPGYSLTIPCRQQWVKIVKKEDVNDVLNAITRTGRAY